MATDLIESNYNFFTTSGLKITPLATASFLYQLAGLDEYDVNLYPSASSEVWYGILVKKTAGLGRHCKSVQWLDSCFKCKAVKEKAKSLVLAARLFLRSKNASKPPARVISASAEIRPPLAARFQVMEAIQNPFFKWKFHSILLISGSRI
ncbi:hypothetical protein [Bacillus sp. ISL-46]|uniref:hypothetical protein n=1 Tax=Bacillus sp. ISL-46 TaxID=2819129 RepID=UPI001BE70AB4|nr:hypothetical protein [Bacillus sp. ISL-46]MBT2722769.1 hypothetical protein [Bacillus sp. ISL-46]